MIIDLNLIITAVFTSSLGSLVRIGHDSEVEKLNLRKGLMVYVCSICTGYICYELSLVYEKSWIVGVPSLLLSLAAVEITNVFRTGLGFVFEKILKAAPDLIIEAARRALNLQTAQQYQQYQQPNNRRENQPNQSNQPYQPPIDKNKGQSYQPPIDKNPNAAINNQEID